MVVAQREHKIIFFMGEPSIQLKASTGVLTFADEGVRIAADSVRFLGYREIKRVELVRINSLGTTVRIGLHSETLSLAVPRINIGGQLVVINLLATKRLAKEIENRWGQTRT